MMGHLWERECEKLKKTATRPGQGKASAKQSKYLTTNQRIYSFLFLIFFSTLTHMLFRFRGTSPPLLYLSKQRYIF